MRQTKAKAIRKAVKKVAQDEHRSSMYWIKRMPIRKRIGYAIKILKGDKS